MKKCLPIVLILAMAAVANAGITTVWELSVMGAHPAGWNVWEMWLTTDVDWTNSRLEVDLTAGSMRHIEGGFPLAPQPGLQGFADTACYADGYAPASIVDWSESAQHFVTSWKTNDTDDIGTLGLAMLTLSNDARGELRTWDFNVDNQGEGQWTIYPIIPEPATMALLGVGGLGVLLRKKR